MNIGIVGLGLIGGSIALDLKSQINVRVFGTDASDSHSKKAMELHLVHEILTIEEMINVCDVLIIAVPVTAIEHMIHDILDKISNKVLIDVGSTKSAICASIKDHVHRGRFVAAHPLAGTEFSGPEAAIQGLFRGKKNIICDQALSDEDALNIAIKIFESIGLNTFYMSSDEHDKHVAYVSHLSHVSSFMLGKTVLNIEKDEKQIFNLAGTGFESTVRLAKSNPHTWKPIFMKNKKYVVEALSSYIELLQAFKLSLENEDDQSLLQFMEEANDIKRILNKK